VHRDVRGCSAEIGNRLGVCSLCENPSLRGPLSHVWVSIFLFSFFFFCFFLLFFLFRILVVVFASEPTSTSICSFSLSFFLSLLPLEVSVYLSIFSALQPSNVYAIKAETGAKLAAPYGLGGRPVTPVLIGPCSA
jgi:hypothetical protein